MKWTQEIVDEIAVQATIAMHKEFDDQDEPDLKKIHPAIVPGMVRHVLDVADKVRDMAAQANQSSETEQIYFTTKPIE